MGMILPGRHLANVLAVVRQVGHVLTRRRLHGRELATVRRLRRYRG